MGKMGLQRRIGCLLLLVCLLGQGERILPARAQSTNIDEEIVYLDTAGFIRALEPQVTTGQQAVQWVSPVGGWRDFALADFNGDGDAEIVAVGGDSTSGRLTIYDPVIASGRIDATRVINGIPWGILYETQLPGAPLLVSAGDLVPTIAGNEIAYVLALNPADRLDPDDLSRLLILQQTAGSSDGSDWQVEIDFVDFGNEWDRLALGDLDNSAGEEIVLVDRDGFTRVYLISGLKQLKILDLESGARPWQDGIVAQWVPGSLQELLLIRSAGSGATFWSFYYNPGDPANFSDGYSALYVPIPRLLFAGDINNNGDDELFFLRTVPTNLVTQPHLFMLNAGTDTLPVFEHRLDVDNGYLGGAAGDTDGDGRAEVTIMRNNNVRVYTDPESNGTQMVNNVLTAFSDSRTIHLANLDRNGVVATPQLATSATQLVQSLSSGADPSSISFNLTNTSSGAPGAISFAAHVVGNLPWLAVSPSSGVTPATVTVTFDPRNLPAGVYTATLAINSSNDQVLDLPLTVGVTATVREGLRTNPELLSYVTSSCDADSAPQAQSITLTGPSGQTFAAQIVAATGNAAGPVPLQASAAGIEWPSAVGWVTASSPNVLPTTMVLTFFPAAVTETRSRATLQLTFFDAQSRQTRSLALSLFCATEQIFLPLVAR